MELAADEQVYIVQPFDDERFRVEIGTEESWTRTVLVLRCGGEEQAIAPNLERVFFEGESLLGCTTDDQLVAPAGVDDTNPTILAEQGCAPRPTPHGLVTIDVAPGAAVGRLLLVRDGATGLSVEALLDDLLAESTGPYFPAASDTHAYGRTSDASAWEIDLRTGARSLLVERADAFSPSPQYVLYRPLDDTDDGKTAVVLRDRETGSERMVMDAYPENFSTFVTDAFVQLGHPGNNTTPLFFWTDDLTPIEPPLDMRIVYPLDDGRFWLTDIDASGLARYARWRRGDAAEIVWECHECVAAERPDLGGLLIEDQPWTSRPYELFVVDEATGESTRLAGPVVDGYRILDDRRVLTVLDHVEPGPFVLHDHRDGSARTLVELASPSSMFLTSVFGSDDDRDVLWVDEDPAKPRALYYARLADATP